MKQNKNNSETMDVLIANKELIVFSLLVAIEDLADKDIRFPNTKTISNLAFAARQILMLEDEEGGTE